MNVVVVSHGVSDQALLGGPGRVAAMHAVALADRGHQVTVVTSDLITKGSRAAAPTFEVIDRPNVTVEVVPGHTLRWWPGSIGPVFDPKKGPILSRVIAGADVVHGHEWPLTLVQAARRLASRAGIPTVIQPHGSIQPRSGARRLLHGAFNTVYRLQQAETLIVGSDREEEEVRRAAGTGPTILRLKNPMPLATTANDDPRVRVRRDTWGFPNDATIVLYAHRVTPSKGLDLAIRAIAGLPPTYCLAIVGQDRTDAPFTESCKALAAELGIADRVRFFGPVSLSEIEEVVLAADIFLLPARRDTFPLMVLHALACNRPVVLTQTCQSVDLLDGAVAVAAPTGESIAGAIASLDAGTVARLTAMGRSLMVDQYSPDAVARQLEAIYGGLRESKVAAAS